MQADGTDESKTAHLVSYYARNNDFGLPLSEKAQLPEHVTSIGTLTLNQMRRGIDNCIYRRHTGILPDLAVLPVNWFEPELSFCVLIDGRVCGLLLVHKQVTDTLEAELFYASEPAGKQDMIGMIKYTIRHLVENTVITNTDGQELQVTISAGITTSRTQDTPELMLKRADELMYQSKHNGRNRVTTDVSAEDI